MQYIPTYEDIAQLIKENREQGVILPATHYKAVYDLSDDAMEIITDLSYGN